jgi:hypothetical protein
LRGLRVFAAVAAMGFGACADGGGSSAHRETRHDSAGVEIVEIAGDPWTAPAWATLDSAPMKIVPDDAKPETLFGRVRGTMRLRDGRIAVLDIAGHRVLLFEPNGTFDRSLGREGQGPGELAQPWRLVRAAGDTIGVYDREGHLELLALSGEGARRVRIPTTKDGSPAQVFGTFAAGDYLAILNEFPGKIGPGTLPLYSTFQVMGQNGEAGTTLGRHQSAQFTFRDVNGQLQQVETLFWAEPGMAALPAGYVYCRATELNCEVRSRDGVLVRIVRSHVSSRTVTDADVDELAGIRLADVRTAADSISVRRSVASAERMERFPVTSVIRTDARGRLWMRQYVWHPADTTAHWIVFDPTGKLLGTVTMPADFQVFDVGDDYVLGVQRGADDVEEVVMYSYEAR